MKQLLIAALFSSFAVTHAMAARLIPAASAPAAKSSPAPAVAPAAAPVSQARPDVAATIPPPAPAAKSTAPVAAINSRFYAGAQVGDSTIGALLGLQLNKMYAMEISYDYVDTIRTSTAVGKTSLEVSRIGASGLAMFPIKFNEMGPMAIFVKVGYASTRTIYTVNSFAGGGILLASNLVTTTNRIGVTGGAGVQVDLSTTTTARLGVNYLGGDRSVYLAALYEF